MPSLLNVNNYHYRRGGSDAVYLDHGALMEARGWRCGYFAMHHPENVASPWSRHFVSELEFGAPHTLRQNLSMATKSVYSLEARRKLRGLLQEFRPDVAHLHCIYHHHSPAILPVLTELDIPVVMTAHDLKIACPNYKMLNRTGVCERCKDGSILNVIRHRCVRDSLAASAIVAAESVLHGALQTYRRHLSTVVVPSRFFLEKFVEWGWPRDQFRYIPNFIDASGFAPDFAVGDYFLYFGRLAPEKGIATLVRAAKLAGVQLKIAGSGPEESALHALQGELQADVEFVGFRTGEALRNLIRAARAVVLPSEWYENAPMSVLESFALGKPVIGARVGGIPELVLDGATGWCFGSGDVLALTEALGEVRGMSHAQIEQTGKAARALVEQHFGPDRYVHEMLRLYSDLGVRNLESSSNGAGDR